MKATQFLLVALISFAAAFVTARYLPAPASFTVAPAKETAFARVMRTGVLHCGYYVFAPVTARDPNTNELSGFSVDMMNYMAKKTGLKIEWAEEVNFANWVAALQANRFDASCTPMWGDAGLGRAAKFSRPMFFTSILPVVRADEARFAEGSADQLNKPDLTIAVQEGNASAAVAHEVFPQAKIVEYPQSDDYGTIVQNVLEHKADVVLWDRNGYIQYDKNNPGKIKILALDQPLKLMPFEIAVGQSEGDLRDFFDGVIEDMHNTGEMDRLLDKWEGIPGTFIRVAKPYR